MVIVIICLIILEEKFGMNGIKNDANFEKKNIE